MSQTPNEFYALLPLFEQKFCGRQKKFDEQRFYEPTPDKPNGFFMYYEQKRPLLQSDWVGHFFTSPRKVNNKYTLGSLSLSGLDDTKTIKWISIDIDDAEQMKVWNEKLKPKFDSLGYEYFQEWGGNEVGGSFDRCHVLLFYDNLPIEDVTNHLRQIFYEIGEPVFADERCHFPDYQRKTGILFNEIFPINKPDNKIRPPLGPHIKPGRGGRRYPCQFKDQITTDPIDVMYMIINIKPVTLEDIKSIQDPDLIARLSTKVSLGKKLEKENFKRKFFYKPINLGLPFDNIPAKLQAPVRNCQAIHDLLENVKTGLIDERGDTYHYAQLMLRGITKYHDAQYHSTDGEKFYDFLRTEYRFRPDEDHHLDRLDHDEPIRYFSSCEKWSAKFGMCEGCPFAGKIGNPVRFINGKKLERVKVGRVKLTNLDDVRNIEFPKLRKDLIEGIQRGYSRNILYGHGQGFGKTYGLVQSSIAELVKIGRKVLVAVPTVELASQYRDELKKNHNVGVFILASHKGHFNPEKKDTRLSCDDCPFYDEIQRLDSLGVSSSTYKADYCANCPLASDCSYPAQYTEVQEPEHDVVIIQHAHFSCQEVLFELMKKNFDVLFVDETFIDSMFKFIPITTNDIELLEKCGFDWTTSLARWLKEEHIPSRKLNPPELELQLTKTAFDGASIRYIVPDLIRFYNQRRLVKNGGVEVIYELPNIPTRVFTDATAPLDLMKHLTGIDDIEVYGTDLVLDPKTVHPDNEVIQVLDFTASVSWLQEEETFNLILEKIAQEVSEMSTESKVVITSYLGTHQRIKKYLEDNHPHLLEIIQLSAIQKGVNKFSSFDKQYVMANILFMPKDYHDLIYKYISVANHFRAKKGLDLIPITTMEEIKTVYEAITRIEGDGIFEYPQFKVRKPADSKDINDPQHWYRLIYYFILGEIQQGQRLRLTPDKARETVILNNVPLPSTQITKTTDLNSWLNK